MQHVQVVSMHGANGANGRAMPAMAKRETWQDWWPDEPDDAEQLLTREALLAELQREGFLVSGDDLRNWQAVGAIPYAVRRWHNGATRALYPRRMVEVIGALRTLQSDGRKMAEIREALPGSFRIRVPAAEASAAGLAPTIITKHVQASDDIHVGVSARAQVRQEIPAALKEQIAAFAREHEQVHGRHISRAEVRLIDEQGIPVVIRFDPHETNE